MCSINHDLEAIFIHTPKCGGLFIEKVLEKYYGFSTYYFTHENHEEFVKKPVSKSINPSGFLSITEKGVLSYFMSSNNHNYKTNMTIEKWKRYKKFAVIRNPYDRFSSALKYIYKNSNNYLYDINLFIKIYTNNYLENKFDSISGYDYFHLFIPQYQHLINTDNELNIDFFIKFETLNNDLCDILLKLGIEKIRHRNILLNNKKINSSSDNENYCKIYDNELINFVNNTFSIDFNKFNFNKISTLDELNNDSLKYFKTEDQFCKENISLLIKLDNTQQIVTLDEIFKYDNPFKYNNVKADDINNDNNNDINNDINNDNNNDINNDINNDNSYINNLNPDDNNNNDNNNNNNNNNDNNNNDNNNNDINKKTFNIKLPNGMKLNLNNKNIQVKNIEVNNSGLQKLNITPEKHYNNILTLFSKLQEKYPPKNNKI